MSETQKTTANQGDWKFAPDDVIRKAYPESEKDEIVAPTEYRIKWRLRRESDDKRCYYVEKEQGTHLFTASAIEGFFEVINTTDSLVFDDE